MAVIEQAQQGFWRPTSLRRLWPAAILAAAVVAGGGVKLAVGGDSPLWLDEAWTAAIAGRPGLGETVRQIYWDVNAPLYYLLIHLWQALFGVSNAALRAPSLAFALAAPVAAWRFSRGRGFSAEARATWAALIALWGPAFLFAQEARCYALLLLLCSAQTCAFVGALQARGWKAALPWTALSALACLTHYDAGFLVLAQGAAYLARHRRGALWAWPAALPFVPAAAWLAVHAPRIAAFARPQVAWYAPLSIPDLPDIAAYALGSRLALIVAPAALAVAALLGRAAPEAGAVEAADRETDAERDWMWAGGAALAGLGLLVALGFLRPCFTLRYVVPFAPGLLVGLVGVLRRLSPRWSAALSLVLVAAFAAGDGPDRLGAAFASRSVFSYEAASTWIGEAHPSRLVFSWDHPAAPVLMAGQLEAAGGVFLRRAGRPVPVAPVVLPSGRDPNPALAAAATPPGSAVLWLYDLGVHGTAAQAGAPRLDRLDPRLECRNFGRETVGVIACRPRFPPETREAAR